MPSDLAADLRYGLRGLLRAPAFGLAAVCSLALGTGATAAIFSVLDGVVLRPLPYAEPERLVSLWDTNHAQGLERETVSPVTFLDYRALDVFEDAAAWWRPEVNLTGPDLEPVRVSTVEASSNFFAVLGVQPVIGAGFEFDGGPLHEFGSEVAISHRLWRSRFGADPAIVGQSIVLDGEPHRVAGVMPPGFQFPGDTDAWQRLAWDLAQHSRHAHFMEAVARLRPGATAEAAQRELDALTTRLAAEFAPSNAGWGALVVPLHDQVVGGYGPALLVLFGAVGLLLLVACFNVANLLLARSTARARELAVRSALGAGRGRLVRQLLVESLLVSAVGTTVGLALAWTGVSLLVALSPIDIPRLGEVGVDLRVFGFAALVALATTVAFGLLPALQMSRPELQAALGSGSRTAGGAPERQHTRHLLVVLEVALAVTLLVGAGLLVRSLERLLAEDPGVRPEGLLTVGLQLSRTAYPEWPQVVTFYERLLEGLRDRPEIQSAGAANFLPLAPGWRIDFGVRGWPPLPEDERPDIQYHTVTPGYFETVGVPLLRGRLFDARDTADAPGVVLINEAMARQHFAGEDPIGQVFISGTEIVGPLGRTLRDGPEHEIVGIVGDVKNTSLQLAAEPAVFFTVAQFPFRAMHVVVAGGSGRSGAGLLEVVRHEVRRLDAALPLSDARSMGEVLGGEVDRPRFLTLLMGVFALLALTLAAIGVYGVLAYSIGQRRQEISIRMALGAERGAVIGMVVTRGMTLALAGAALGLVGAYVAARAASEVLYGVAALDGPSYLVALLVIAGAAFLACLVPARRAASVDPATTLRSEV